MKKLMLGLLLASFPAAVVFSSSVSVSVGYDNSGASGIPVEQWLAQWQMLETSDKGCVRKVVLGMQELFDDLVMRGVSVVKVIQHHVREAQESADPVKKIELMNVMADGLIDVLHDVKKSLEHMKTACRHAGVSEAAWSLINNLGDVVLLGGMPEPDSALDGQMQLINMIAHMKSRLDALVEQTQLC